MQLASSLLQKEQVLALAHAKPPQASFLPAPAAGPHARRLVRRSADATDSAAAALPPPPRASGPPPAASTTLTLEREQHQQHQPPQQSQQPKAGLARGGKKIGGSTVVITGGSQGVGKALAQMYAREGRNVVVAARQLDRLQAVADECSKLARRPESALAVSADVSDAAAVARLVQAVQDRYEHVDVVVNNAGVCTTGQLEDMPEEDIARVLATNSLGPALVSRAFLPLLKASASNPTASRLRARGARPTLVMVNSFAARIPMKNMSVYTASKYALAGFADSLRYELQAQGIHVAQVHPGVIASDFLERATYYGESAETIKRGTEAWLKSGSAQTPEQVARAVVQAVSRGESEVMIGKTFKALASTYQLTGLNPMAMLS